MCTYPQPTLRQNSAKERQPRAPLFLTWPPLRQRYLALELKIATIRRRPLLVATNPELDIVPGAAAHIAKVAAQKRGERWQR